MSSVLVPDNGEYVVKGNVNISGNLITDNKSSILSSSNVDLENPLKGQAALDITGGLYVGSDAYIGGNILIAGDVITLGLTDSNITFSAGIASDVKPSTDNTVDLGSQQEQWNTVYTNNISLTQTEDEIISEITTSNSVSKITTLTNAVVSMADGNVGDIKIIYVESISQNVQLNPENFLNGSNIVFTRVGDSATFIFRNSGWLLLSQSGLTSVNI